MMPLRPIRRRNRSQRGFALLEVLVAFALAAVVLGLLVYGVAAAVRSDVRAKANRGALSLAQSKLEAIGVEQPLRLGTQDGEANGYRWRQVTTVARPTFGPVEPRAKQAVQPQPASSLYWVEITVAGSDGTKIKLAALKIAGATR